MKHAIKRSVAAAALLITVGLASLNAKADVIITLAPALGTDLSNVHVGDILVFNSIGSSSDAGEHFIAFPHLHLLGEGNVDILSGFLQSTYQNDLSTNPIIVKWTVRAEGVGAVELLNGWPECVGLPNDNSGCAITNLGSTRPADSNHLTFQIAAAVPTPSSVLLLAITLLLLVWSPWNGRSETGFSSRRVH